MRALSRLTDRHYLAAFWFAFALVLIPGLLFGQDGTTTDAGLSPLGALALAALTPVVAWISVKLYDGLKTILPHFDRLPALVHQVAAPFVGLLFGWLAGFGLGEVMDIHAIDAAWINSVLNMLLMAGIKRYEKSKEPADTTLVLEASRASQPDAAPFRRPPGASFGG